MPGYLVKHYFWMCLRGRFQKRLAFKLLNWVKQMALSPVWVVITQSFGGLNKTKKLRKGEFTLSLLELRHSSSPTLRQWRSGFLGFWTHTGTYIISPMILRPSNSDWIIPLALLVLQLADGKSWDFSASKPMWANSYIKFPHIYIDIFYWFCFSGEVWLIQKGIKIWACGN